LIREKGVKPQNSKIILDKESATAKITSWPGRIDYKLKAAFIMSPAEAMGVRPFTGTIKTAVNSWNTW